MQTVSMDDTIAVSMVNSGAEPRRKKRSGSETRQRNRQCKLSLLDIEEKVMMRRAAEAGYSNIQQYILAEFVAPQVEAAAAS